MRIFGRGSGKSALQEMPYLRPMTHSVHYLPVPLAGVMPGAETAAELSRRFYLSWETGRSGRTLISRGGGREP
jgi:hypothetical protein